MEDVAALKAKLKSTVEELRIRTEGRDMYLAECLRNRPIVAFIEQGDLIELISYKMGWILWKTGTWRTPAWNRPFYSFKHKQWFGFYRKRLVR